MNKNPSAFRILSLLFAVFLVASCNHVSVSSTENNDGSNETSKQETISSSSEAPSSSDPSSSSEQHVHSWDEWIITVAPTCINQGEETRICLVCNAEEKRTVAALGHDYSITTVIKESNGYQDGLNKKECSRCHDVIEEIVPSTSPFTFSLNADQESYTVTGYYPEGGYQGEDIVVPETFNGLSVNALNFSFDVDGDDVPNVYLPNQNLTIKNLSFRYSKYYKKAREMGVEHFQDVSTPKMNLFFKGNVSDWLSNVAMTSTQALYSHVNISLYFYDEGTNDYIISDVLVIPEGVEEINSFSLYGFAFKEIICPFSLKMIKNNSIYGDYLKVLKLNEGVTVESFAIVGLGVQYFSLPKNVTLKPNAIELPNLLEMTIEEGVTALNKNSILAKRLIKINNLSASAFEYPTSVKITNDNASTSVLFSYGGFDFALVNEQLYLIGGTHPCLGTELRLPETVQYGDKEYNQYILRPYAFETTAPLAGPSWPSADEIVAVYGGFDSFANIESSYTIGGMDLFKIVYIPRSLVDVETIDIPSGYVFGVPHFLTDVFFDGTQEEFYELFNDKYKLSSFKYEAVFIHAKNQNGEEIVFQVEQ